MSARHPMQDTLDAPRFDAAPTTRCYPRSMHHGGGAFRQDPEYACALTRPAVGDGNEWWLYAACAVAAVACSALGLGGYAWLAVLAGAAVAAWRMARRNA